MPMLERFPSLRLGRLALGLALTVAVSACGAHRRADVRVRAARGRAHAAMPWIRHSRAPPARPQRWRSPRRSPTGTVRSRRTWPRCGNCPSGRDRRSRACRRSRPPIRGWGRRWRRRWPRPRPRAFARWPPSICGLACSTARTAHSSAPSSCVPRIPVTHDAMARLWRDEGSPHLALGDAYRAVHYSRGSAGTRNTLGTVAAGARPQSRGSGRIRRRRGETARCRLWLEQPVLRVHRRRKAGGGDRGVPARAAPGARLCRRAEQSRPGARPGRRFHRGGRGLPPGRELPTSRLQHGHGPGCHGAVLARRRRPSNGRTGPCRSGRMRRCWRGKPAGPREPWQKEA